MFDRIEKLIGLDNLNLIKSKTVLLVGLGGVGGSSLLSLVRSGIENIIIIDFDIIDITNLNRQVISYQDNIGNKKINEAVNLINRINPNCNVKKYDMFLDSTNINEIFNENKIDYVIDAVDSVKTKEAIILECLRKKIKFISCMGTGNKFNPSLLEITDIRKTNNDPLARIIRKKIKENNIKDKVMVVSSTEVPVKSDGVISSLSFVPNTAGILMASYVVNDIIKK